MTNYKSRYDENEREFLGITLARQIFSAIYTAATFRKEQGEFSRAEFGQRTGRDKTGVSKLLTGPGNWTTRTISDVSNALDLEPQVVFVDRSNRSRVFTEAGVAYLSTLPVGVFNITISYAHPHLASTELPCVSSGAINKYSNAFVSGHDISVMSGADAMSLGVVYPETPAGLPAPAVGCSP
jgi:hypothetical protein